nr:DUF2232 domain-containing protein [Lysinibacillus timonensis]
MPNNQTKGLVQGAMMIAIFALLIAIAFYVPIIFPIVMLFTPLPLAWYSAKYDWKMSIFVASLGCVLTFFIGGLLILPFSFTFAFIGVVIGSNVRLKKSKLFLLMSTGLSLLITFAIEYLIFLKLFEIDFIKTSMIMMRENYAASIELSKSFTGQSSITMEELEPLFLMTEAAMPAVITLAAFGFSFIIISVNLPVLKRLGITVPKFSAFKDVKMPRSILWYYLIVLSINLFLRPEIGSTLYVISLNLSIVLSLLLTIQGLSFIHYFLDKKFNASKFSKVLVTIMVFPLYSFVVLIGILDLGFNVRSLVKDKIQK